jgi:GrpB-like predicted nucleotidyltransferase (UPF0157 family)
MCAMRNIHIVPYNPDWQPQYESEAARLRSVFGDLLVAIHHIGSTSVPGLHAKPLIDIMPIVRDIERVEDYNEVMVALGYTTRGENGISGRRYFTKGKDDQRSHHVHIYAADNPEVTAHLQFAIIYAPTPPKPNATATSSKNLPSNSPTIFMAIWMEKTRL